MREAGPWTHRLRLISWAFIIIGLPISIALQLWLSRISIGATVGEQPGGTLRVRVVEPGGGPARGHSVELQLMPVTGPSHTHETVEVDREGWAAFEAPPLLGKYRLLAGGGSYQRVGRERSFLGRGGEPVEPAEALLELREGVQISLNFTQGSGAPVTGGSLWLQATTLDGPLLGLLGAPIELAQDFEGGGCLLEGLPPLEGTVQVRFRMGTELEFQVRAESGRVELAYEL